MISGTGHGWPRHHALLLVVAMAVVGACGVEAARPEGSAGLDDLKTIKERILAPLLAPVDAPAVERLVDTLQADGSWPSIDYHEKRRSAWTPVGHLGNVLLLARAYRSPGSKLTGSTELRDARDAALDYWLEHDFQNSNWWRINHRYAKDEVSREMFSAWIEHGSAFENASYAYAVVPGVERASLETYAAEPPLEIVNRAGLQAVWHEGLEILGAAFYERGRLEIRPALTVAVDEPCLVLLRERPERLVVSVSNPKNKEATVSVDIGGRWGGENVEAMESQGRSRGTFELPGGTDAGRSVTEILTRL